MTVHSPGHVGTGHVYVLLDGFANVSDDAQAPPEDYVFSHLYDIRSVLVPPSRELLERQVHTLEPRQLSQLVAAIPEHAHEIKVPSPLAGTDGDATVLAHRFTTLVRARSRLRIRTVAASNTSWRAFEEANPGQVAVWGVAGEWQYLSSPATSSLAPEHACWAIENLVNANVHYANSRYLVASDLLRVALLTGDPRVAAATAWAGIDALVGASLETTYRTTLHAALVLGGDPKQRTDRWTAIKGLYGSRSDAVHGAKMTPDTLAATRAGSIALLGDLICVITQYHVRLPTERELTDGLLGAPLASLRVSG